MEGCEGKSMCGRFTLVTKVSSFQRLLLIVANDVWVS